MAVSFAVFTAANMNPIVLHVGCFHDQLIKVAIVFNPVEPHFWFMVQGSWFTISDSRFMVQGSGLMVNERAISTVHHQSISGYTAGGL